MNDPLDRLRFQKCDNCQLWKRPHQLTHVTVVQSTGYVRSREHPEPIMSDVIQFWCDTCREAILEATR